MSYPISEQLLKMNRSGESLNPQGIVLHSTATPNATAQNEHDYFNSGSRGASAHYFVDWSQIIHCIPNNEVSWGAGPTANHKYLNIEMCEPTDSTRFDVVWDRTVWLVASLCVEHSWSTGPNVWSHRGMSQLYHETDHTDPIGFLAKFGKSWNDLIAAIDAKIIELKKTPEIDKRDQAINLINQAIELLKG